MKKLFTTVLLAVMAYTSTNAVNPDEGMWLPMLIKKLNYTEMQKLGLKLTPEQIYDINNASMKDAIVSFGGFCTGEIVSGEGLVLTNHHCGYDAISKLSTADHNHLKEGFWAMKKEQELHAAGLFVNILVRMDDVSDRVKAALEGVDNNNRMAKLTEVYKQITDEAIKDTKYNAVVREMYNGLEYYLFVYERFTDIRLVGTPPESIGKFGGDTDNWMWPRHTGDFSVFRIYAGPDNKPAAYSPNNVPYKPKHFLPVSMKGIKPGDYTMTFGYPGRTSRYLTSYGIRLAVEETNPAVIKVLGKRLDVMKEQMDKHDSIRLIMVGDYASIANSWKYYIGQNEGLIRLNLLAQKTEQEKKFNEWVNADEKRRARYGEVTNTIASSYGSIKDVNQPSIYLNSAINASQITGIAGAFSKLREDLKNKKVLTPEEKEEYRKLAGEVYKEFHRPTEQNMLAAMLTLYYENVSADKRVKYVDEIVKKNKGKTVAESFSKYAAKMFDQSVFASKEKFLAFLEKPNAGKLDKDPVYAYTDNMAPELKKMREAFGPAQSGIAKQSMLLVEGMREMMPEKTFYPDANGTPRISYGKVINYSPKDAVQFEYRTTLKGVIEKEDPKNPEEFTVPSKLKDLYNNKDYGMYSEGTTMPVCFISDNDITGGNSGSPVINGSGQLVGIAFDGNWEAMTGDIVYDKDLKRCINVDIRYVLFVIDKLGGAGHLVKEMQVIR